MPNGSVSYTRYDLGLDALTTSGNVPWADIEALFKALGVEERYLKGLVRGLLLCFLTKLEYFMGHTLLLIRTKKQ